MIPIDIITKTRIRHRIRGKKMRLYNYKKVWPADFSSWLANNIPNLTPYQKEKIYDEEFIRCSKFVIYERCKTVTNVWYRLSIVLLLIVWLIAVIGLPLNFLITGNWGYSDKTRWLATWMERCGF